MGHASTQPAGVDRNPGDVADRLVVFFNYSDLRFVMQEAVWLLQQQLREARRSVCFHQSQPSKPASSHDGAVGDL